MPQFRHELTHALRAFHQFREHLHTSDGVVIYKDIVVIPPSLQQCILSALHSAHQGTASMMARAEASVFWPGITTAINASRANCEHGNRMAPSQPSAPPTPPILPVYPFQCVCSDFFSHKGMTYLIIFDRNSNWPIVEITTCGADGLINSLRRSFATYGIPDEISTDGGPEYIATATRQFVSAWWVNHRLSSVAFHPSNYRAEIGVKTIKRLITNNTGNTGDLDTDAFRTPNCLWPRAYSADLSTTSSQYCPADTNRTTPGERPSPPDKKPCGTDICVLQSTGPSTQNVCQLCVRIQKQIGPHPNKWDKTGAVVEVRQFDQYVVRVDGSGRMKLRNRKFLRKYVPVIPRPPRHTIDEDLLRRNLAIGPHMPLHATSGGGGNMTPAGNTVPTTPTTPPLTVSDNGPTSDVTTAPAAIAPRLHQTLCRPRPDL